MANGLASLTGSCPWPIQCLMGWHDGHWTGMSNAWAGQPQWQLDLPIKWPLGRPTQMAFRLASATTTALANPMVIRLANAMALGLANRMAMGLANAITLERPTQ